MRPHPTGAGLFTAHHQADLQAPARVSGATHDSLNTGAPARAASPQLALPLIPPSPSSMPARSNAARVAAFMSHFFDDDPSIRALLEATAAAEERRARRRKAGGL